MNPEPHENPAPKTSAGTETNADPETNREPEMNAGQDTNRDPEMDGDREPSHSRLTDATGESPVRLLQPDELHAVVSRWREIQAEFVDQPKRAMQEADELVTALMDRLAKTFADQREQLEARWTEEQNISTEELRQGLQRYRSFFERLLAA